jgi:protein TonB
MLHGATAWGLLGLNDTSYTPPNPNAGFEVVDLSAFGAPSVPEPEPVDEKPIEQVKSEPLVEPIVEPEPTVVEEPAPTPLPVPVAKPVMKPQPVQKAQPIPQPKQQMATPPGNQNAFVPPSSSAAYLHNPKPTYPAQAQRRNLEGVVVVAIEVSEAGEPLSTTIKQSSGFMVLDKAALQAVRVWRFAPATRGGRAVSAQVDVPIRFSLNDA